MLEQLTFTRERGFVRLLTIDRAAKTLAPLKKLARHPAVVHCNILLPICRVIAGGGVGCARLQNAR
jgi:hypothetical protein